MLNRNLVPLLAFAGLLTACAGGGNSNTGTLEQPDQTEQATIKPLKEVFRDDFMIGAALNAGQVMGRDAKSVALVKEHFNTISPENSLKWEPLNPKPGVYNWAPADAYVNFGVENNMFVIGHTLVWHSQAPDWIFEGANGQAASRDTLLQRMQKHINLVAGRYKGKIGGWDVVNEALQEDGSMRKSKWLEIIGEDFVEKAFEYAAAADPQAELYYNDYNLWRPEKRDGAVRLVRRLLDKGIRVDGIGMQGHYGIDYPSLDQIEASIQAFSALGVKVMVTELDIDILPNPTGRQGADIIHTVGHREGFNPYASGMPDSVEQKLNKRYADIFGIFHKHRDKISRVTLWGVADHHSWLNNWPMPGRTSYPLLFDRNYQPKSAFHAVVGVVNK